MTPCALPFGCWLRPHGVRATDQAHGRERNSQHRRGETCHAAIGGVSGRWRIGMTGDLIHKRIERKRVFGLSTNGDDGDGGDRLCCWGNVPLSHPTAGSRFDPSGKRITSAVGVDVVTPRRADSEVVGTRFRISAVYVSNHLFVAILVRIGTSGQLQETRNGFPSQMVALRSGPSGADSDGLADVFHKG